jgi:hypothetical protein
MSKRRSVTRSAALFYGLKEIPFEPTGAAAGKYPYVAPREFDAVEERIREVVNERKLYVMLLKAPQGGGKTATTAELKARADSGKYVQRPVTIIANRLLDLDISHYASDFLKQTKESPIADYAKKFVVGSKTAPSEAKNDLVSCLLHAGSKSNLVLWIIDEFDILVDRPKREQSGFLQFIREIVDELANEHFPIMFLMCHTMKSSKEFEQALREAHGPMHSRIVTALEIGYTFDETRQIIGTRLASVSTTPRDLRSIEPFTDESLRYLYDLVVSMGAIEELNDFRFFERCCYFTMLQGAKSKDRVIDKVMVRKVFEKFYQSAPPETAPSLKLSAHTRTELAQVAQENQMVRNEAIFEGIRKGLELMKAQFADVTDFVTDQCAKIPPDMHVSYMEYTVTHKGSKKTVHTLWVLVAKQNGMILKDDLIAVANRLPKILPSEGWYANVRIFSYVSDLDIDTSALSNFDEVIRIPSDTARALMTLGVAAEEDIANLRSSFDSDLAPTLGTLYATRIRDVTKGVSEPVIRLVRALNISQLSGKKLSRELLKEEEKTLFLKESRIGDRHLSDLVELGFATEHGGEIRPSIPGAIKQLLEMLQHGPSSYRDLSKEFGDNGEAVVEAAKALGLIEVRDSSVSKRAWSELQKSCGSTLNQAAGLLKDRSLASTYAGKRVRMLLDGASGCRSDITEPQKTIVFSVIQELLPDLVGTLESQQPSAVGATTVGVTKEQKAAVPTQKREIRPGVGIDVRFEDDVKKCLEDRALSLVELETKLKSMGYTGELRSKVLGMVLRNQIKLSQ